MNKTNNTDRFEDIKDITEHQISRRTILSLSFFFVCFGLGCAFFFWLFTQKQGDDNIQPALRKSHEFNDRLFSSLFSKSKTAKEYKPEEAVPKPRVNGKVGMEGVLDTNTWRLKLVRAAGDTQYITLNELKSLPKTDVIYDFKCVEGWSELTHWGGVRFADFIKKYNLNMQATRQYVGLITPDSTYYVGIDIASMLQPQTILCYEMNGKPLPQDQGYPLRLIIPVKYGIKHLKRIGLMYFSDSKPRDYWAERGYDYYSGL